MQMHALGFLFILCFFETYTSQASQHTSTPLPAASTLSTCHHATAHSLTRPLPQVCPVTRSSSVPLAFSRSTTSTSEEHTYDPANTPIIVTSSLPQHASVTAVHGTSSDNATSSLESVTPTTSRIEAEFALSSASASLRSTSTVFDQEHGDSEFPLDHVDFLSFEDWRKQKLAHSGQSADAVRNRKIRGDAPHHVSMQNALDSLGDDSEIEINFGGLVGVSTVSREYDRASAGNAPDSWSATGTRNDDKMPERLRSKDAGKTCKERSNYASFDCAANVLKTNPKCKSASSVLVEHKDSYMLNECAIDNKFLIIELCDNIKIDTVVLANFEFFSSMFRTFRISVSDRYPVRIDKWKVLGTYEARNTRDIQAFLVDEPLIWTRYLRVEFLTHYGGEFYCPLSLLRVHGTTMMEEVRYEQELARGEIEPEYESQLAAEAQLADYATNEAQLVRPPLVSRSVTSESHEMDPPTAPRTPDLPLSIQSEVPEENETSQSIIGGLNGNAAICLPDNSAILLLNSLQGNTCPVDRVTLREGSVFSFSSVQVSKASQAATSTPLTDDYRTEVSLNTTISTTGSQSTSDTAEALQPSTELKDEITKVSASATSMPPPADHSSRSEDKNSSQIVITEQAPSTSFTSATMPSHVSLSGEESFFKSIHKRLQALETNATLSLQYIESQSFILREAFTKVEKHQMTKTTHFLESLNSSIFDELLGFRREYENLWQNTISELAGQREQIWREREAMGERIRILAEEMVSQKRLMAAQATLLLLCLGIVVFARAVPGTGIETGLLQSMHRFVKRKQTRNVLDSMERESWHFDATWASLSRSMPSTRPSTSGKAQEDVSSGDERGKRSSPRRKQRYEEQDTRVPHDVNSGSERTKSASLEGSPLFESKDLADETQSAPTTPFILEKVSIDTFDKEVMGESFDPMASFGG